MPQVHVFPERAGRTVNAGDIEYHDIRSPGAAAFTLGTLPAGATILNAAPGDADFAIIPASGLNFVFFNVAAPVWGFQCQRRGHYHGRFAFGTTVVNPAATVVLAWELFINGGTLITESTRSLQRVGNIGVDNNGHAIFDFSADLVVGDVLDIRVTSDSPAVGTIRIENMLFVSQFMDH